ncbi:MAG: nucleoside triphosphate pyrophosphatase [Pseudanabaenaceae cyanobacterium bins.39]|nr:nucleoside triphosphate pyrophosphatase [Pseudanabaenaceae cyanobacterium bins.39]
MFNNALINALISVAMTDPKTLILASASPTRKGILENAGFQPLIKVSHFDEDAIQVSDPASLVLTLAQCKAKTVADALTHEKSQQTTMQTFMQNSIVIGCDSIMYLQGMIYGKPDSEEIAIATWQKMRGNYCELYTGHCLIDLSTQRQVLRHGVTKVYFSDATDAEIQSYVDSGEPMCCAGCFTLERLGGLLIDRIEGCHTNVLGLSLPIFRQLVKDLGYAIYFSKQGTVIR